MSNLTTLACPAPHLTADSSPSAAPFASVIVPVYNDDVSLQRLLQALEQQDYGTANFECVLIDNGSTEPLRCFGNRSFKVRILHESRAGSYAARNCGLQAAQGTILAFTDADCIPEKTWLSSAVRYLSAASSEVIVGGRLHVLHSAHANNSTLGWHSVVNDLDQASFVSRYHFAATANMVTTPGVFQRVGTFKPELLSGGDLEWGQRAWKCGVKVAYCEATVVQHPARADWRSLVAKTRRIAGGHYTLHRRVGRPLVATILLTAQVAAGSLRRSWLDPRLPTLGCRLRVLAIDLALRLIQLGEVMRLWLGGQPCRR